MVPLGEFVPHQLLVAVTALPRFSRLLPVPLAVFPDKRQRLRVTGPAPIAPVAMPPPVPVDWLLVMVTLLSVTELPLLGGFIKSPPPLTVCVPLAPWPFMLPVIIVPWSINRLAVSVMPPPAKEALFPEIMLE